MLISLLTFLHTLTHDRSYYTYFGEEKNLVETNLFTVKESENNKNWNFNLLCSDRPFYFNENSAYFEAMKLVIKTHFKLKTNSILSDIKKPGPSDLAWSAVRNRNWRPRKSRNESTVTSQKIRASSRGRFGTGSSKKASATRTRSPASARSPGFSGGERRTKNQVGIVAFLIIMNV